MKKNKTYIVYINIKPVDGGIVRQFKIINVDDCRSEAEAAHIVKTIFIEKCMTVTAVEQKKKAVRKKKK